MSILDVSKVEQLKYTDILGKYNFLSLDISVNSTGWVIQYDERLNFGIYKLQSKDNRERRREFGKFLIELIEDKQFDFIIIEDVIAGCNFKTTRSLTELNIAVEDLIDYDCIPDSPVFRIDNKEWKRVLHSLVQDDRGIRGSNDKEMITFCLNTLGFYNDIAQDVYDAMGIACAYIFLKNTNTTNTLKVVTPKKLKQDLTKNYKIVQYKSKEEMLEQAELLKSRGRSKSTKSKGILYIDYDNKYKDLLKQFTETVYENGDNNYFCIHSPLNKIGSMFITFGFDLTEDDVYFMAYLK